MVLASSTTDTTDLVIFSLNGALYALHLSAVERVVAAAEITPLPNAPEIVLGIVNLQGQIVPVVNLRKRFNLEEQPLRATDQFVIAHTAKRKLAMVVDHVEGVEALPTDQIIQSGQVLPDLEYVEGVLKLSGEIVIVNDLGQFLSLDEEQALARAMEQS